MRLVEGSGPASTRELAEVSGIGEEGAEGLAAELRALQAAGYVVQIPRGGWDLPRRAGYMAGRLRVDRRGRAAVRSPLRDEETVDVHREDRGNAADGDLVLVELERARRGRPATGGVVRIIERRRAPVRGTYRRLRRGGVVIPDDPRIAEEVLVSDEHAHGAADGDRVLLRLAGSDPHGPLHGEVAVHLRDEGSFETDFEIIREEFDLPGPHGPAAEAAAAALPALREGASWPERRDLRDLLTFTIDPEDAKDFDDAVSLEELGGGRLRLGVHIADVSHYVRPESELDAVAAGRGTSIYLPGRVLPMLPERLANDLCSLRPGEDRLTKSVFLTFGVEGKQVGVEIASSVIRSRRRLTYTEVQSILDGDVSADPARRPVPEDEAEIAKTLRAMDDLRADLFARRKRRGALTLDIPRIRLDVDESGEVRTLYLEKRDRSHEIIEEFMLAANEAVAAYFVEAGLPLIGRVHPPPEEERLAELQDLLAASGFRLRGKGDAKDLQRLVEEVSGHPLSPVIQLALLRTMGHAEYIHGAGLHFALATDRYCHFTSPIRRYPDLLVHQVLDEHFQGRLSGTARMRWWRSHLERLAADCSEQERRAESAERAMTQLRLIRHLEPRLGEIMDAWIVSVHTFGFFVRTEELPIEGLVHIATLSDDFYIHDPERFALRGRRHGRTYRIGDAVRVRLSGLEVDAREIRFELAKGRS